MSQRQRTSATNHRINLAPPQFFRRVSLTSPTAAIAKHILDSKAGDFDPGETNILSCEHGTVPSSLSVDVQCDLMLMHGIIW